MNVYVHKFRVKCPVNSKQIKYTIIVYSDVMIHAEDLMAACNIKTGFHEPLADVLYARFGGRQHLQAMHHGVRITTLRGFDDLTGTIGT